MALFSDIDWMVLLAVGAFIFLGPGSAGTVRQLGRYYAKLMKFKQQMLADLATAADLPAPAPGQGLSIRRSLMDFDTGASRPAGIPVGRDEPSDAAGGSRGARGTGRVRPYHVGHHLPAVGAVPGVVPLTLSIDDTVTVVEVLVLLLGIAITWAVYYGSDNAELPGEARIPDPTIADESGVETSGRTLN